MSIPRNKLIPVLGLLAVLIIGTIVYIASGRNPGSGTPAARKAATAAVKPADGDNPSETLSTVVASNAELRKQVQAVIDQNAALKHDNDDLRHAQDTIAIKAREQVLSQLRAEGALGPSVGTAMTPRAADAAASEASAGAGVGQRKKTTALDRVGNAVDQAVTGAGTLFDGLKTVPAGSKSAASRDIPKGLGFDGAGLPSIDTGPTTYKVVAPLGYDEAKDGREHGLVRKTVGVLPARPVDVGSVGSAGRSADMASLAADGKEQATPYFTIPENATLTRLTAMTAIVGRVPVDGRVTDPMQFKAIVGRENLAANGWDLPDDLSGIVVSGVAIGDMALSCSEGKIHSLTFVFADGSIRTVSTRRKGAAAGAASEQPLGFISDQWGNPCIPGKFVTNAPSYLTDVVGLRALGVASSAYAAAQTTTTDSAMTGTSSSSVTGDRGAYVLGQSASAATDEVTKWVTSRLKNSFDAVVTRAGEKVVLHVTQQVEIDKAADPRKLDHGRLNRINTASGERHGLD